jgi:hypothetical protein
MPITTLFTDGHPIEVRAWGDVTTTDVTAVVRDARLHVPTACPPLLVIASDVTSAPELSELRSILKGARGIPGLDRCRIAFVTRSEWVFGVGRAISAYASLVGLAFEVFRDEVTARLWLTQSSES